MLGVPDLISDDLLRAYLLGTLDEQRKETIENAYLTSAEENERLSAATEDLIEDYLDGRLDVAERNSFELFFLQSPERRQDLALTRALRKAGKINPGAHRSNPLVFKHLRPMLGAWAALGLLLVSTVLSISLYMRNRTLHSDLASLRQENAQLQHSSQSPLRGPGLAPVLVELRPGLTRDIGDAVPVIKDLQGKEPVNFVLQVPDPNYSAYSVVLRSAEGAELLSQARLSLSNSNSGSVLSVWVSASALSPGDYQFVLFGIERKGSTQHPPIAFYNFRVSRM